ncbi:MAG: hypothetical protein U0694_17830 [Anaerolineae bacterium]
MRRLIPLVLMLCWLSPVFAQDEPPPYLYYYTDTLNAFVIERADGSDSRTFGAGLTPSQANVILGPGWSPDGHWFAWQTLYTAGPAGSYLEGFVVNVDNSQRLTLLDEFADIELMNWSPDGHYLLVSGCRQICYRDDHLLSYWLFDMSTQRLAATYHTYTTPHFDAVTWFDDYVVFTENDEYGPYYYYTVTLYFDGRAVRQPISYEEYQALQPQRADFNYSLDSPSGRYTGIAHGAGDTLTDTVTDSTIEIPPHSDAVTPSYPLDAHWHPSEEWVLFGYNRNYMDSLRFGGASVMSLDGQVYRELGSCGFSSACVDWLPAQVDPSWLPAGEPQSVLLAPISYEYTVVFGDAFRDGDAYILDCDESGVNLPHVNDAESGATVFVLPSNDACIETYNDDRPFPFIISPDGTYYVAVADAYLGTMGIYDVQTGERLFALNTYGFNLHFSADGTQLIMRSRNAVVTWDVAAINEAIAQRSSDSE